MPIDCFIVWSVAGAASDALYMIHEATARPQLMSTGHRVIVTGRRVNSPDSTLNVTTHD